MISKYSRKDYKQAVKNNLSYRSAYLEMSGSNSGSGLNYFRKRVKELGIDTSHFRRIYTNSPSNRLRWQDVLVNNRLNGTREKSFLLRRVMLEYGIIYACLECKNKGEWMEKTLRLEIDHINGNNVDNRPNNLRFLCPNCHSQKPCNNTWNDNWAENDEINYCLLCGNGIYITATICYECNAIENKKKANSSIQKKRKRTKKSSISQNCNCGSKKSRNALKCITCENKNRNGKYEKYNWPTDKELKNLVWEKPITHIAQEIGCSDVAVRKRCKNRKIKLPQSGHWLKKENRIKI